MEEAHFHRARGAFLGCFVIALAGIFTPSMTVNKHGTRGLIVSCYSDGCGIFLGEKDSPWTIVITCVIGAVIMLATVIYGAKRRSGISLAQHVRMTSTIGASGNGLYLGGVIWYSVTNNIEGYSKPGYSFFLAIPGGGLGLVICIVLQCMSMKESRKIGVSQNTSTVPQTMTGHTADTSKTQGHSPAYTSHQPIQGHGTNTQFRY